MVLKFCLIFAALAALPGILAGTDKDPFSSGSFREGEKTVLVAGASYFSDAPYGFNHACYWKNGEIVPLYSREYNNSESHTILYYNESIYISGWTHDFSNTFNAVYWIDDSAGRVDLGPGRARGMTISGTTVYVAGHFTSGIYSYPCYWEEDERVELSSKRGWAMDIDVYMGDVYTAGRVLDGVTYKAGYWINRDMKVLTSGTGAFTNIISIKKEDGNVYAAGTSGSPGSYTARYWINSKEHVLPFPEGADESKATGMFIYYGDVYVSGYYLKETDRYACYWKNGKLYELNPAVDSMAYNIHVFENSVYVTGNTYIPPKMKSCVWVDGEKTYLSEAQSTGFSVYSSRISKPPVFTMNH